jgi:4-hydroxyproline epimerase
MESIDVIDSHTGGEPTRIIVSGGPDLGLGPLDQRLERFRTDFDGLRSAVVNEPRGSDVMVGGLLCEPHDPSCSVGVLFFNGVGYLGMCGHGTIGLVKTLQHLGRADVGRQRIDTCVGPVEAELLEDGRVRVHNVASYRHLQDVALDVPGLGRVRGDVAYGGNWFFLVKQGPAVQLEISAQEHLTAICIQIRAALAAAGISGTAGAVIDHVELFGAARDPLNHSRNFVLCPGSVYDRSPCGTGTSAKLACLAADGALAAGENWNQESIIGSVFSCSYEPGPEPGQVLPSITGAAYISAETRLLLDARDPFRWGIRSWESRP